MTVAVVRQEHIPLRAALRVLKQLVVRHAAMPVLDQIRLEAKGNQLTVEGTDIDTRVCFTPLGVPIEWPPASKKKPLEDLVAYESL